MFSCSFVFTTNHIKNMDNRQSLLSHNVSVSPRSLMVDIYSSVTPHTHSSPRHRKWKIIPPPLNLGSIEEQDDGDYLDLGAETPSTSNYNFMQSHIHIPVRRRSFHRASSPASNKPNRFSQHAVDRDCGIWYVNRGKSVFSIPILNL
jgi:hypothetical protein